jgi:hypothetical protein
VDGARITRSVSISVVATDNVAVAKMQLFVDGVRRTTKLGGSLAYTWNANQASTGMHTLLVQATDGAGNVAQRSIIVYK